MTDPLATHPSADEHAAGGLVEGSGEPAQAQVQKATFAKSPGIESRRTAPVRVVIPTFRREALLGILLRRIDEHLDQLGNSPPCDDDAPSLRTRTEIVVIDNDPAGSASSVVTDSGTQTPIRYVHEPRPGIGAVRARALTEVEPTSVIVFIDDDELPSDAWIEPLVRTWEESGAQIVVGQVIARYEKPPSAWIEAGEFFVRLTKPTGTEVTSAATSNMLLDVEGVTALGLTFDADRGLYGGEDTLLTRSVHRAGGRILWCAEAAVYDLVPADRATRKWVLARRFSHATTSVWIDLELTESGLMRLWIRLRSITRGAAVLIRAALRLAFGTLTRQVRFKARGARDLARGLGLLGGAIGHKYEEYRRETS